MEKILKSLKKKSIGYNADEITYEYIIDDNGIKRLVKEKKTRKHYPPDMMALKMYLDLKKGTLDFSTMSDEVLERERIRLIRELLKATSDELIEEE